MKSIHKFSFLFLFVLYFGCTSEDLEVEPVNEFLSENFYQTDSQVASALIAAYDPLGWTMAFGEWISPVMFGEIRSDNAFAGGDPSNNDQPGWQEFDDFRNNNVNTVTQAIYRRNYIGIFRSNLVILKPEFTSPSVELSQAEAKFLRAYYHFELFKHFGPVPVITTLLSPEDTGLERNTMTEMFTAIEADLLDAVEILPISVSSNDTGRATKGAAQALLGKVYLYWADMDNDNTARFDLAAEQLRAVVNSGAYVLEDDYDSLFDFGVKNPAESVFEIQRTNLFPSDWGWFEGIEGNGIIQLCGVRGLCDGHPEYTAGWGFMLPTSSLYDTYFPDDSYRRDASIIDVPQLEEEVGPGVCDVVLDLTESNPIDFTGYWQEKFGNYKGYDGNNINGGADPLTKDGNIYVIRYADVLLMLAEALHRGTGSDGEAMQYINEVRERGAGPGDNTGNYRTAQELMGQEGMSLQDVIWYERRIELALEGDRWFDLVRSDRATPTLFAGDNIRQPNFDPVNDLWLPITLEESSVAPSLTEYPDPSLFQ
jgi:hypothetical protein